MSKGPGGTTITIDCMIVSGFPGIGKTTTFNEMKKNLITAKVADMDVRNYGTTNGINVADPAAYVAEVERLSKEIALIFVTSDPQVRQKLQEAHLFYIVIAPEFPPQMAANIPGYVPDLLMRQQYMRRFKDHLGANTLAGNTLDGKGYEDAILDIFNDPMPHLVAPVINKQIIDQAWRMIEGMTRQVLSPGALVGMGLQRPPQRMIDNLPDIFKDGIPK